MPERVRRDFTNHVAGFLARNLPEVEVIGPDVLLVLMESDPAGDLAIPSQTTELADLLTSANAILEIPLPADPALSRQARQRRVHVYFRYLLAAKRRLGRDRKRATALCIKAGRWGDYARMRYWSFLTSCELGSLALGGLRYRVFGTPQGHAAITLRQRSHRIISIRSGAIAP